MQAIFCSSLRHSSLRIHQYAFPHGGHLDSMFLVVCAVSLIFVTGIYNTATHTSAITRTSHASNPPNHPPPPFLPLPFSPSSSSSLLDLHLPHHVAARQRNLFIPP